SASGCDKGEDGQEGSVGLGGGTAECLSADMIAKRKDIVWL
ncbi:MAG: hypothetical protein RIR26_1934, partial [Pseudomonadota bacterium]